MFKRYRWGNWTDLMLNEYDGEFYLLQAKRRADGKLKFRVEVSEMCLMEENKEVSIDLEAVKGEK